MRPSDLTIGWDIGGAHVKAALVGSEAGSNTARVIDVMQWPCPLWQGLHLLTDVLEKALLRWPQAGVHAITMTGELADLFEHREAGVRALADTLVTSLPGSLQFFAGESGWCLPAEVGTRWAQIASANWWASAQLAAQRADSAVRNVDEHGAVLVDIGSTTTDLIALRAGRVLAQGRSDAQRLARGELVYQGVVRTPLCALAPRIAHRGEVFNVMNEFFATTADVYRLNGELDPAHDQHPPADGAPKDAASTRRRLARMIGLDARDASDDEWLTFAQAWRRAQCDELRGQLERVVEAAALSPQAAVIGAGCGDFLAEHLAAEMSRPYRRFDSLLDAAPSDASYREAWMQVGAPAVAVAWLWSTGWQGAL